jgi:hypothetical protein
MTAAEIEQVLARIRAQMDLDSETEHEVLEEIRSHLEEAVAAAQERGLDEQAALAEAAVRLGVEEVGFELQQVHAGWGTGGLCPGAALADLCPRRHRLGLASVAHPPSLLGDSGRGPDGALAQI